MKNLMKLTSMLYGVAAALVVAWLFTAVAGIEQLNEFGIGDDFDGPGLGFWDYVLAFASGSMYLVAATVALTGGAIIRAMTEPDFGEDDENVGSSTDGPEPL